MGEYLLPVVAGVVCGLLGGAPYAVGLHIQRKGRDTSILPLVGAACVSLVVLALSVLVGYATMRDVLLVFACAVLVAFLVTVIASVVLYGRKPRS